MTIIYSENKYKKKKLTLQNHFLNLLPYEHQPLNVAVFQICNTPLMYSYEIQLSNLLEF